MTPEEAAIVLDIMCYADGECPVCARRLVAQFVKRFPQFEPQAIAAMERHGWDYKNEMAEEFPDARG